ncbi:unnamed protein product, partial [Candidula unifasciata]
ASEKHQLGSDSVLAAVSCNGDVLWYPPFYLESTCKLDMSKYPFDVSVCPVEIYSWMQDNTTIVKSDHPVNLWTMLVNEVYEISSAGSEKITHAFDNLFFDSITFKIRLARRPTYVAISLLIPVNLLAILSIMSFIMPPDEQEKVNISVTILLSFTVFLTFIDSNIPPNSDNVSLLFIYISLLLLMSFLSVVGNILVVTTKCWNVGTPEDCIGLCRDVKNISEPPTTKDICGCSSPQYLTQENNIDSIQPEGGEKRKFVSENRESTYKSVSSFALKSNRVFLFVSCFLYVFITCLMFALISK